MLQALLAWRGKTKLRPDDVLLGCRTQWGDPLEFARVTATSKIVG
jgi:hypothetical protein